MQKTDIKKRDKEIIKKYKKGVDEAGCNVTMQTLADEHNVSRQRIEQILRNAGVERSGKKKTREITFACQECDKDFRSYQGNRKYCSLKCSHLGRRKYKTKKEIEEHKKRMREYYAEKSHNYYHNIFKKRKDWKDIVRDRNRKNALKNKKK
jgi:hypothetical protein